MALIDLNEQAVTDMNRVICQASGEPHGPSGVGSIASCLHSTFYPGGAPYEHGGVAGIAGAMTFYIAKAHAFINGNKRTASAAALGFMKLNGYRLSYPGTALGEVVVAAVNNALTLEELKIWFDVHKETLSR